MWISAVKFSLWLFVRKAPELLTNTRQHSFSGSPTAGSDLPRTWGSWPGAFARPRAWMPFQSLFHQPHESLAAWVAGQHSRLERVALGVAGPWAWGQSRHRPICSGSIQLVASGAQAESSGLCCAGCSPSAGARPPFLQAPTLSTPSLTSSCHYTESTQPESSRPPWTMLG